MQVIETLGELRLPEKYIKHLDFFLKNLSKVKNVEQVILFGSCARGSLRHNSDVDLMVIGDNITDEEEVFIYADCSPQYPSDYYLECDIFTSDSDWYDRMKTRIGSLQWRVEKDGKDLTKVMKEYERMIEV